MPPPSPAHLVVVARSQPSPVRANVAVLASEPSALPSLSVARSPVSSYS